MSPSLTLAQVHDAHARIKDKIHRTPVLTSATLDAAAGAELFFKCENFQKAGAFKARGATNAVFSLSPEEAARGVATHSSGNHAAALARAAKLRGIPAHIVMPSNASRFKKAAVVRYGGQIICCEPTLEAREATAAKIVAVTSATFIHACDDLRVMAGQGTAALELLQDVSTLDAILCPVGGGGLLSGTAVVAKAMNPSIKVFGVKPESNTIADGLLTSLGKRPFAEIQRHVDEIVTVSDAAHRARHAHPLGRPQDRRRTVRRRGVRSDHREQIEYRGVARRRSVDGRQPRSRPATPVGSERAPMTLIALVRPPSSSTPINFALAQAQHTSRGSTSLAISYPRKITHSPVKGGDDSIATNFSFWNARSNESRKDS